jgi:type II secretory pathway pseudopilin PulG
MNEAYQWWIVGGLAAMAAIVLIRWMWHLGKAVKAEQARELFRLQHERFEEQLLTNAAATGLPRGLKWMSCEIIGDAMLVREMATGAIVALVPVIIQFEPIEGSDMEDVPAARDPRTATAVFSFSHGTWKTAGKVVFNHTPEQTVSAFSSQFRIIHDGHH